MKLAKSLVPACALLAISVAIGSEAAARPMSEIVGSGVLRACMPTASPPDGDVQPEGCTGYCGYGGVLGELVDAFATSPGLETEFWVSDWDGLFQNAEGVTVEEAEYTPHSLATDRCDMIGAVMVSLDWRRKKMDLECFLPSRMMIVTQKDRSEALTDITSLGGLTASVERSMAMHTWIDVQNAGPLADNPIQLDFRSFDDSIPAVDRGDVDFTVVHVLDALYHTRNIVENSSVAFAVGPVDEGCWGYEKGDTEMGDLMKAFFAGQTTAPDSELNAIWESYYGLSFADFVRLVSTLE